MLSSCVFCFVGIRKTDRLVRAADSAMVPNEEEPGASQSDEALHGGLVSYSTSVSRQSYSP